MQFIVNGKTRTSDTEPTVSEVVTDVTGEDAPKGVAVAVNGGVVPASDWSRTIKDGEIVDILVAVQGG